MDSAETRIAALLHRRLVESEKALMHHRSDRPKLAGGSIDLSFTADVFPRSSTISYSICCPSLSVLNPARSTAEMWTNTSWLGLPQLLVLLEQRFGATMRLIRIHAQYWNSVVQPKRGSPVLGLIKQGLRPGASLSPAKFLCEWSE
jgi:hypothetical protein